MKFLRFFAALRGLAAGPGKLPMVKFRSVILTLAFCSLPALAAPVHDAARAGNVTALAEIIRVHPDQLNARNEHQDTPLIVAVVAGQAPTVKYLISQGADLNIRGQYDTPLGAAALDGRLDIARQLLAAHVDVDGEAQKGGYRPLTLASLSGHFEMMEFLLAQKANIAKGDDLGDTALHESCRRGDLMTARWLVAHGAPVDAPNLLGVRPLVYAAENGRVNVLEFLLKKGAAIDAVDGMHHTALWRSALHSDSVEALLRAKANVSLSDKEGVSPLDEAVSLNQIEAVRRLLAHGANPNQLTVSHFTPLMGAVLQGNVQIAELLLGHGARVDIQSLSGATALNLALDPQFSRDNAIVTLLRRHGAKK